MANGTGSRGYSKAPPTLVNEVKSALLDITGNHNQSSINPLLSSPGDVIRRNKLTVEVNNLAFPSDLAAHAMVFVFKESKMMKSNSRARPHNIVQSVALPIPANLIDTMNAKYNEMDLGTLGGAFSDIQSVAALKAAAVGGVEEAFNQGTNLANADFSAIKNNQGIATLALTNMFRKKSPGMQVGLARFFGSVPNPHLTALFEGIGLKNHSFSWKLSPANIKESVTLKNIIRIFKRAMLPKRTNQNLTLEFPDEVDIYIRGHLPSHGMYEFKTAVLKNVSINYAPDNIPSFYAGTGAPTHVDFKLEFLETTIHTREDYPAVEWEGANTKSKDMGSDQRPNPVGTDSQGRAFGHKPGDVGAPAQRYVGININN